MSGMLDFAPSTMLAVRPCSSSLVPAPAAPPSPAEIQRKLSVHQSPPSHRRRTSLSVSALKPPSAQFADARVLPRRSLPPSRPPLAANPTQTIITLARSALRTPVLHSTCRRPLRRPSRSAPLVNNNWHRLPSDLEEAAKRAKTTTTTRNGDISLPDALSKNSKTSTTRI